jgi:hypothetical protein
LKTSKQRFAYRAPAIVALFLLLSSSSNIKKDEVNLAMQVAISFKSPECGPDLQVIVDFPSAF